MGVYCRKINGFPYVYPGSLFLEELREISTPELVRGIYDRISDSYNTLKCRDKNGKSDRRVRRKLQEKVIERLPKLAGGVKLYYEMDRFSNIHMFVSRNGERKKERYDPVKGRIPEWLR